MKSFFLCWSNNAYLCKERLTGKVLRIGWDEMNKRSKRAGKCEILQFSFFS